MSMLHARVRHEAAPFDGAATVVQSNLGLHAANPKMSFPTCRRDQAAGERPPPSAAFFMSRSAEKSGPSSGGLGAEPGPPIPTASNAETSGQRSTKLPQLG